jgi:hypothetical protein
MVMSPVVNQESESNEAGAPLSLLDDSARFHHLKDAKGNMKENNAIIRKNNTLHLVGRKMTTIQSLTFPARFTERITQNACQTFF